MWYISDEPYGMVLRIAFGASRLSPAGSPFYFIHLYRSPLRGPLTGTHGFDNDMTVLTLTLKPPKLQELWHALVGFMTDGLGFTVLGLGFRVYRIHIGFRV